MMLKLFNKTKWFLKKVFLFTLNPYLAIKNKFDFDFLSAFRANKKLINENNSKYHRSTILCTTRFPPRETLTFSRARKRRAA